MKMKEFGPGERVSLAPPRSATATGSSERPSKTVPQSNSIFTLRENGTRLVQKPNGKCINQ